MKFSVCSERKHYILWKKRKYMVFMLWKKAWCALTEAQVYPELYALHALKETKAYALKQTEAFFSSFLRMYSIQYAFWMCCRSPPYRFFKKKKTFSILALHSDTLVSLSCTSISFFYWFFFFRILSLVSLSCISISVICVCIGRLFRQSITRMYIYTYMYMHIDIGHLRLHR